MSALMEAHDVKRKLVAILAADVKGYSRLMGEDEEATLHMLNAYRQVTDARIERYQGRIVSTAGDSILAEFASVIDAVRCAVEIQQELKTRNAALPAHRQMAFRIGINLGDVMIEGEQIYGDGVNIAARLESLAEAGGICISGTVYEQIENKLSLQCESLGEQTVKNIAKPVRVWRIQTEKSESPKFQVPSPKLRRVGSVHRSWILATVAGLLLSTGTIAAVRYLFFSPNPQPLTPSTQPAPSTQDSALRTDAAPAALLLPDKPSIVVLPFVNMSEDPKQDYFSDGLTEVLTSDLSKLSGLFVISRNSAFYYKGKAAKLQDVSKELGVRYVVEGSVQRASDRSRITAQLIDATQDHHLWSERYDRPLTDIFALQDELVQKIVTTLKLQLPLWEQGFLVRKTTSNLEAYDYWLRGVEYFFRLTKEANAQARQMFEQALALDPQYAWAYGSLGVTYYQAWIIQWEQGPGPLQQAFGLAQKAVALDDALPDAHLILGQVYLWQKQHELAMAETERAIALDPNNADGYVWLANILKFSGRPQEAIHLVEKAMRLNPHYPFNYLFELGLSYFLMERNEEAVDTLQRVVSRAPNHLIAHLFLTASYSELGREAEARAEAAEILRLNPTYSLEVWRQITPFKDPAVLERVLATLRKAGLK